MSNSSLDRKIYSFFKRGVFEGNLTITGTLVSTGLLTPTSGLVLATNSMLVGVAGVSAALAIAVQSVPGRAAGAVVDIVIAANRVLGRVASGDLGGIQITDNHIDAAAAITLTKINWVPGIVMGAVTGIGLSMAPVAAAAGLKIHTHLATGAVYDYANEFKGESVKTSGFYDGLALDYQLDGSGTSILRAIRATVQLNSGKSMTGTDYATQSMLAAGVFSASVSGTINGAGVTVAGILGQIGSNNLGTLTTCKYMAAVWADWASLVELGAGTSAIILATVGEGAGAAIVDFGIRLIGAGKVTTGIGMSGAMTTGIRIEDVTGNGIYITGVAGTALRINKTANTAGTMVVHCHQLADPLEDYVINDFKGEVLHVANGMTGIGSSWVLDVNSAGSLNGIMSTVFLGDGRTLSGAGSLAGISGGVAITAGIVNGADVILSGVIAGMMQSGTGVLTACKYMSALWASSVLNAAPSAGESQLVLLTAEGATIDQAMFISGIVSIDKFLNLDTTVTAGFVTAGATVAGTPNIKLKCKFGTTTFYLQGYDS